MVWSNQYKRSIDCDSPKGFSQRAHCAARKKRSKGEQTKSKSPFNEMHKIKSHKSVEDIASKHGVDISFIKKQLEMGIPIEHEHTKDKDLATDIALQHLGEIPDYYTRLKKMEADAKKEIKEHCGCEEEAVKELESGLKKLNDISYDSIDKLMRRIMKKHDMTAKQLHYAFVDKHDKTPDDWIKNLKEGTLHHWFKGSKSKDGKPGWVQADGSPCANEPGETKTPKCFSSARLSSLKRRGEKGEALIRSAVRRKRQEDPGQQQKSGAAKPTMVKTFAKGKKDPNYIKAEPGIKEEMEINEAQKDRPGKGSGKKDACYHKVKSRYDVWPSAYASGALVKCRKVGAANWGTKSEEVGDASLADVDQPVHMPPVRNMHVDYEKRYCPKCKKEELRSECQYGTKYWDMYSIPTKLKDMINKEEKDHEHSMARSELSTIDNAVKRLKKKMKGEGNIEAWVQSKITKAADYLDSVADYIDSGEHKVDEMKCWPGYKKKGTQELFGKKYNRCVKAEDVTLEDADGNTFAEVIDLIQPKPIKGFKSQVDEAIRMQSQTGNVVAVTLMWRGKYYGIKMFFPQIKLPTRQEINDELQKVYPGSNVVYHSVSEIQPGQPLIQAFGPQGGSFAKPGPNKNYVKPMGEEVEVDEDWQKVNRQDKTDGLSQKAVNAYRRENPGSKLQTAVTEKNPTGKRADRRKSFCRRMKGMKSKLTSDKTARDPDSRINKALRRWNCN
jgi:hypothetical protein